MKGGWDYSPVSEGEFCPPVEDCANTNFWKCMGLVYVEFTEDGLCLRGRWMAGHLAGPYQRPDSLQRNQRCPVLYCPVLQWCCTLHGRIACRSRMGKPYREHTVSHRHPAHINLKLATSAAHSMEPI